MQVMLNVMLNELRRHDVRAQDCIGREAGHLGRDVVDPDGECATGDPFPVPIMIITVDVAPAATAAELSK